MATNPRKPLIRPLFIVLAICFTPVLCIGSSALFVWLGMTDKTDHNPANYASMMPYFDPKFVAMLPRAIPSDATNVRYTSRLVAGMGPSSVMLEASFRVAPEVAARILADAKSAAKGFDGQSEETSNEIMLSHGDQQVRVTVDLATGVVTITINNN